jgi:uncharacterized protein YycO
MPGLGDFAVVRLPGPVGTFIRFGRWLNGDGFVDFEHAFVLVNRDTVLEAIPGGARLAPLDLYRDKPIAWYSAPDDKRTEIASSAVRLLGTPYSFLDYAALAAVRLHLPSAGLLRAYVASTRHLICSQLVDLAYCRAGVELFDDGRLPGDVTPADLYGLITSSRGV